MKKKMNKVLVVCTAAAAMTAFSGTAFGATLDLESKTAVADAKDGAGDIQEAINQISGNGNKDGWTIKIKSGTYDRFTIPADFKNITVEGEKNSVIQVMNASVADNLSDAGGINAFGSNITLKGLTIDAGNVPAEEGKFTAAVSNHNGAVGGTGFSLHVENCTIKGTDSQFADGILFDSPGFDVKNCKISGFKQAVEFFGDNFVVPESGNMVSGNTVRDCSFAIHGYFGGGSDGGVLSFKNNKVTGTDDLRAKVVIQDLSNTGAVRADISGNTFVNALVGLVNLRENGKTISPVLTSNEMGVNSFYVEAVEPGTIEFYATYHAPENSEGCWRVTGIEDFGIDAGLNPDGSKAKIEELVDAANESGSRTLSITGIDENNLIKTFTYFKDGIYWDSDKESKPSVDKKADGQDRIEAARPGDVISFTLESNLPQSLSAQVKRRTPNDDRPDDDRPYIIEKKSYQLIFHDKMSSNLSLNQATLKVEIMNNGKLVELPEKYYMVRTDLEGETFRVTVGLVAAFNDGQISYDQLKNAAQIVVSYDATVKDSVINGDKVENRAWVNDSEEDIVDGPVIDPDVPSTGGIGTKAFTAAGIAMMGVAAGAVIVIGKKKKKEQ